jgi:hypothetical protein
MVIEQVYYCSSFVNPFYQPMLRTLSRKTGKIFTGFLTPQGAIFALKGRVEAKNVSPRRRQTHVNCRFPRGNCRETNGSETLPLQSLPRRGVMMRNRRIKSPRS